MKAKVIVSDSFKTTITLYNHLNYSILYKKSDTFAKKPIAQISMIIESCNNYIIHKVTQILIIMHYLSKISMQTGQCMYKKQKVLRLSNIICIFAA